MDNIRTIPSKGVAELSPELVKRLTLAAGNLNSDLDPGGKIFFKTLAEIQKENTLPPINYVWDKVAQMAYLEMKASVARGEFKAEDIRIPIRVHDWIMTKKNRIRLVPSDRASPMGVVIKNDRYFIEQHSPYACAWFYASQVFRYALDQLPENPEWLMATQIPGSPMNSNE